MEEKWWHTTIEPGMQSNEVLTLSVSLMPISSKTCARNHHQPYRFIRCVQLMLLALMVFAWGTGYKLSLYKAATENANAPAKLCTLVSDAARTAVLEASNGPKAIVVAVFFMPPDLPINAFYALTHRDVEDGQAANPSPFYPPPALDFRPPPARAFALI
jgi:uncharacterized membrane protein